MKADILIPPQTNVPFIPPHLPPPGFLQGGFIPPNMPAPMLGTFPPGAPMVPNLPGGFMTMPQPQFQQQEPPIEPFFPPALPFIGLIPQSTTSSPVQQ
jgi:hypothetical protein